MKKLIVITIFCSTLISANAQQKIKEARISNELIKALLYLPDKVDGYYQATRFDWSGLVASLEYEGHNFYGQWFPTYNPETHDAVQGPVEEFGQVGYNEAKVGGTFLKIGVGILTRPDEKAYAFTKLYPVVNYGTWKIKKYSNGVKYTHTLKDPQYSYVYEKKIELTPGKPELVISHTFTNKGKKPIDTFVYNHNFPVIDKQPVGPGYSIIFPFNLSGTTGQGVGDIIRFQDNKIIYMRELKTGESVYCGNLLGYSNKSSDYDIRIENTTAGAGIRVRCDRPIDKLVYWSSPTTVCPEPYIKMVTQPGEKFTWEIKYEYYSGTQRLLP